MNSIEPATRQKNVGLSISITYWGNNFILVMLPKISNKNIKKLWCKMSLQKLCYSSAKNRKAPEKAFQDFLSCRWTLVLKVELFFKKCFCYNVKTSQSLLNLPDL